MKKLILFTACLFVFYQVQGNITEWGIENGVLTIHLDGNMENFDESMNRPPWFNEKESIVEVVLTSTDKNTSIGSYAFTDCYNLTKVTIPDNTTSINEYAFNGCSNLTDITFPKSVTAIGSRVFFACDKMKSVTCLNTTPPSTNSQSGIVSDAFYSGSVGDPYQNAHMDLYIPAGTLSYYNAVGTWRYFETKTVLATKILINPEKIYVEINVPYTLQAVMPVDVTDKTVTWRSNNEQLVTVHNGELEGMIDNWILTGVANGRTTVTCTTSYGVTASCVVNVGPILVDSINFYSPSIKLPVGASTQMLYFVTPEKAAIQAVEWSTNRDDIVDIDEQGTVTAKIEGEADIIATAIDGGGATSTCKVTVYVPVDDISVDNITFDKNNITLLRGTSGVLTYQIYPLNASNKEVAWTSHNPNIATITTGADHATVYAVDTGEVTITVTTVDGHKTDICKVHVIPVPAENILIEGDSLLRVGDKITLTATIFPEFADNKVKWSSNNTTVATVDNLGQVTAHTFGEATITASATGIEAQFNIRVIIPVQGVTMFVPFQDIQSGEKHTMGCVFRPANATIKDVIWNTTDTTVISIDSNGEIYAKRGGYSTITCTSVEGNKSTSLYVHVIGKDAMLNNITINEEVLHVDKDILEYDVVIDHDVDSITIAVETADKDAEVQGTGTIYNLAVGETSTIITVTSNDKTDIKRYILNITRRGSGDALLKELTINKGTLTPKFNPEIFSYTDTVPHNTNIITILFKRNNEKSTIISNSLENKELILGNNQFTVTIAAEDTNVVKTYTINVRRLSNNALLKELTVNNGTLTPSFVPEIFNYTVTVHTPSTVIETKTEYDTATVSVTGPDSIQFQDNIFTINVESEDKTTNNTYTVNVKYIPGGMCGYNMTWSMDKDILTLKGHDEMFEYPVTQFPWYFHSTSIENIVINEGISTIGNFAFGMCENLQKVTNNNRPQNITNKSVFGSIVLSNIDLFVPSEYVEQYSVADVWKNFGTILPINHTGIQQPNISPVHVYINNKTLYIDSPSAERVDIYSVTGKLLHRQEKTVGKIFIPIPVHHVLIVRGSSGWSKKLLNR